MSLHLLASIISAPYGAGKAIEHSGIVGSFPKGLLSGSRQFLFLSPCVLEYARAGFTEMEKDKKRKKKKPYHPFAKSISIETAFPGGEMGGIFEYVCSDLVILC